jgi:hypothetical protein
VSLAARETVPQDAEPRIPSSEGIDSPRGEALLRERLFSTRGGRDKGRGRRVTVARRSSSVLTGRFRVFRETGRCRRVRVPGGGANLRVDFPKRDQDSPGEGAERSLSRAASVESC